MLSREKRKLIRNVVLIARLVLTNGATSATPKRSFLTLRRPKTWLLSTVKQKRFNCLTLLNENPNIVDKMSLINVANEFVSLHPSCLNIFDKFTDKDLLCNLSLMFIMPNVLCFHGGRCFCFSRTILGTFCEEEFVFEFEALSF